MVKALNLVGQRFGRLVVLERAGSKRKKALWKCRCDCGNIHYVITHNLTRGDVRSCGCGRKLDLTGQRFGRWLVLCDSGKRDKSRSIMWECLCDCGNVSLVSTKGLRSGISQSCGCRHRDILSQQVGELNPNWRGYRHRNYDGYIFIYKPEHPFATKGRYVLEHRLVMEEKIGRYLLPGETVHHANGILDDNSPDNLVLFSTRGQHMKYHKYLDRVCQET